MRSLVIVLALLLSSIVAVNTLAEEKVVCIEFNGQQFCESKKVITIGETVIPITDPFALIESLTNKQETNVSLWEVYEKPAVIIELAKQLNMEVSELIEVLKDADRNWKALHELTTNYDSIRAELVKHQLSHRNIDELFNKIIDSISKDIRDQLKEYEGVRI